MIDLNLSINHIHNTCQYLCVLPIKHCCTILFVFWFSFSLKTFKRIKTNEKVQCIRKAYCRIMNNNVGNDWSSIGVHHCFLIYILIRLIHRTTLMFHHQRRNIFEKLVWKQNQIRKWVLLDLYCFSDDYWNLF